jgi:hypothetical protein
MSELQKDKCCLTNSTCDENQKCCDPNKVRTQDSCIRTQNQSYGILPSLLFYISIFIPTLGFALTRNVDNGIYGIAFGLTLVLIATIFMSKLKTSSDRTFVFLNIVPQFFLWIIIFIIIFVINIMTYSKFKLGRRRPIMITGITVLTIMVGVGIGTYIRNSESFKFNPSHFIGTDRQPKSITLRVYDLSKGHAKLYSIDNLGIYLEAIWHTGIKIGDTEFYYDKNGVVSSSSSNAEKRFGACIKEVEMYTSKRTIDEIKEFTESYKTIYGNYDLFENNCNHFSNNLLSFLSGNTIPQEILDMPQKILTKTSKLKAKLLFKMLT